MSKDALTKPRLNVTRSDDMVSTASPLDLGLGSALGPESQQQAKGLGRTLQHYSDRGNGRQAYEYPHIGALIIRQDGTTLRNPKRSSPVAKLHYFVNRRANKQVVWPLKTAKGI